MQVTSNLMDKESPTNGTVFIHRLKKSILIATASHLSSCRLIFDLSPLERMHVNVPHSTSPRQKYITTQNEPKTLLTQEHTLEFEFPGCCLT